MLKQFFLRTYHIRALNFINIFSILKMYFELLTIKNITFDVLNQEGQNTKKFPTFPRTIKHQISKHFQCHIIFKFRLSGEPKITFYFTYLVIYFNAQVPTSFLRKILSSIIITSLYEECDLNLRTAGSNNQNRINIFADVSNQFHVAMCLRLHYINTSGKLFVKSVENDYL